MTDIYFQADDLKLSLDFLEVDSSDPSSLKWSIDIRLKHPTGEFTYSANDIWLDTYMWDEFLLKLANGAQECACFKDQSEYFCLNVERQADGINLVVSIQEPLVSKGNLTLHAVMKLDLDGAFVPRLLDSFRAFPLFW